VEKIPVRIKARASDGRACYPRVLAGMVTDGIPIIPQLTSPV